MKKTIIALALLASVTLTAQLGPNAARNPFFVAGVLKPAAAGGGTDPDILWAPLNDASGTTINSTVGPDWTTDATLNSDYIAFDGSTDDAVTDSAVTYGTSIVTFTFWVYVTDWNAAGENDILESGSNYGAGAARFTIGFQAGTINVVLYHGGGRTESINTAVESLANTTWYHFGVVFDNSTTAGEIKVYINGTARTTSLVDLKASSGNLESVALYMGARGGSSAFYGGRVDDLRVYSGEKTGTFINDLYVAGRP